MRSTQELQTQRDQYLESLRAPVGSLWERAREASRQLNKEGISLSPQEGRLAHFLVSQMAGPCFVEIGTLTGYSALWILQAMKQAFSPSKIDFCTFEKDPTHAKFAREILSEAKAQWWPEGDAKVEVWEGDARLKLEDWSKSHPGRSLDGILIDGNKSAYLDYLTWAERHLRKGALVLADNVFLRGQVWDTDIEKTFSLKQIEIMQRFNERLADPNIYDSVTLPTAEGLTVARYRLNKL